MPGCAPPPAKPGEGSLVVYALRLHQEVFLLGHDEEGGLLIHQPSLCLGLAGAAVVDLMVAESLAVYEGGRVVAHGQQPHGEPVTDSLFAAIRATAEPRQSAWWLRSIATDIYHRTAGGLLAAGVLARGSIRRGLGRRQEALRPTDPAYAGHALGAVRYAVYGRTYPHPHHAALCGLVAVLRLERSLHLNLPTSEILATLRRIAEWYNPTSLPVLSTVETLLGEAANQVYR